MKRVLVGQLEQETATFNPSPTTLSMFRISVGAELLEEYGGTTTQLGAALDLLATREDVEAVPTYAASSVSGGPIPTADLDSLIASLTGALADAKASGPPVDGIYLSLHGAMAGISEDDPEGRLLTEVRELFGPSVPLVVSLDLHAVLTEVMVEKADIIVPFHTYPHVDQYATGLRATRCLLRMLDDDSLRPVMVSLPLPMLVRGDELITGRVPTATISLGDMAAATAHAAGGGGGGGGWSYSPVEGLFGSAIQMCQEIEAEADMIMPRGSSSESGSSGIAAGVLIGNAFTDVPALRSNILVVRDGRGSDDLERATADCKRIGSYMWENRESFQAELTSVGDAISEAVGSLPVTRGPTGETVTVFSDAA
jgi:microcystin degradation protein MlrC